MALIAFAAEERQRITPVTLQDLQKEVNHLKEEIKFLRNNQLISDAKISRIEESLSNTIDHSIPFQAENLNHISHILSQKWYVEISLLIQKEYQISNITALVDSGADVNCIQRRIHSY